MLQTRRLQSLDQACLRIQRRSRCGPCHGATRARTCAASPRSLPCMALSSGVPHTSFASNLRSSLPAVEPVAAGPLDYLDFQLQSPPRAKTDTSETKRIIERFRFSD